MQVRAFSFPGVGASELASELSVCEIGDLVEQWLAGEPVACNADPLLAYAAEVQSNIDAGGFRSLSSCGGIEAGGPLDVGIRTSTRSGNAPH